MLEYSKPLFLPKFSVLVTAILTIIFENKIPLYYSSLVTLGLCLGCVLGVKRALLEGTYHKIHNS